MEKSRNKNIQGQVPSGHGIAVPHDAATDLDAVKAHLRHHFFCKSFIQLEQGLRNKPIRVAHAFMGGGSNQSVFQLQAFDAGLFEERRYDASSHSAMQSNRLAIFMAVALECFDGAKHISLKQKCHIHLILIRFISSGQQRKIALNAGSAKFDIRLWMWL